MQSRLAALLGSLALCIPLALPVVADAAPIDDPAFQRTWARTDQPVASGAVDRTWMWGPEANTGLVQEAYAESPGGARTVQYFDKSRMELTYPDIDPTSPWAVTNGLLVVELVTGRMQLGDNTFEQYNPAGIGVAGDPDDLTSPTYATFATLLDAPPLADDTVITQRVDRDGVVTTDAALAAWDVRAGPLVPETQHRVASVFWDFLHSNGTVYLNDQYTEARLFDPWYYASGLPISEAYWTTVLVAGTPHEVLVQAFERRVLTYTPENLAGWQVEAGNVGQHYHHWRYDVIPHNVTITNCSDLAGVKAALETGGDIRFACGEVTLDLGSEVVIDQDTTIDGAGVTTLSGGNRHRVVMVAGNVSGVTVTLRGLTIEDGRADSGGGIYADGVNGKSVTLQLENALLRNNRVIGQGASCCTVFGGGAVFSNGDYGSATVTATNVTFSANAAAGEGWAYEGGAVFSSGSWGSATFVATDTTFISNSAQFGGAVFSISDNSGRAMFTATNASFIGNSAIDGYGGAVYSSGTAMFTATSTTFSSNTAAGGGGAVYLASGDGNATFITTTSYFNGNSANFGGAVASDGRWGNATVTASNAIFSGNSADAGGAVYSQGYQGNAALITENTTFAGNLAGEGGAVYSDGRGGNDTFTATNTTFNGNAAIFNGGAVYSNGRDSGNATFTAINTTFSGNSGGAGGAVFSDGRDSGSVTFTATQVTFSGNRTDNGVALYITGENGGSAAATLLAVLLDRGSNRWNCVSADATITSLGYNIADDDYCGLTQPTDQQNVEPRLGPLQDNGGRTLTHALLPGSPAVDSGDPTTCPEVDQRGVARPQDGDGDGVAVCDRGAVEMAASESTASAKDAVPGLGFNDAGAFPRDPIALPRNPISEEYACPRAERTIQYGERGEHCDLGAVASDRVAAAGYRDLWLFARVEEST